MADDVEEESWVSSTKSCLNRSLELFKDWNFWKLLIFGQFLSLLLCGTGTVSQLLQDNYHVVTPAFQSFLVYFVLGLVYTTQLASDYVSFKELLIKKWWKYLILAIIDLEANYLVVKAYNYTSLTSVQLLDCMSIPTVLVLSWLILKVRYKFLHICGVILALIGVVCLVIADLHGSRYTGKGSSPVVGDIFVVSGAILYGISNVAEEFIVRNFSQIEFLGMMGLFASIVSGIQVVALEHSNITAIEWRYEVGLCYAGFVVCMFLFYSLMPMMLKLSSATTVNLSLLTADLYTLFLGLFLFNYKFSVLYFVAFGAIVCGLVIYNIKQTPRSDQEYSHFNNEPDEPTPSINSEHLSLSLTDSSTEQRPT